MIAYISVSFSKRRMLENEILTMKNVLYELSIEPFVFVERYTFSQSDERSMMQQAMADIDRCDFLIAETSEKAIGIGVEVGYAKAKNIPVIYLRNASSEHSTTVSGISDHQIIYSDVADLRIKLLATVREVKQSFKSL